MATFTFPTAPVLEGDVNLIDDNNNSNDKKTTLTVASDSDCGAVDSSAEATYTTTKGNSSDTKSNKVRASITFRLPSGTKSRDFPGRSFTTKERKLLKGWSAEWRRGDSVLKENDLRYIDLRSVEHGIRKKILNRTIIRRCDAYQWFRAKHVLLMSTLPVMTNSVTNTPDISTFQVEKLYPSTITLTLEDQYIQIVWNEQSRNELLDSKNKTFVVWLQCSSVVLGTSKVATSILPVYLMRQGRGSFFASNQLKPGTHTIHGCTFVIQARRLDVLPSFDSGGGGGDGSGGNGGSTSVGSSKQKQIKKRKRKNATSVAKQKSRCATSLLSKEQVQQQYQQYQQRQWQEQQKQQGQSKQQKQQKKQQKQQERQQKQQQQKQRQGKQGQQGQQQQRGSASPFSLATPPPPTSHTHVQMFTTSTTSDINAVVQLRQELGKLVSDGPYARFREVVGDVALYRCLVDAGGDLQRAVSKFQNHLKIRHEYGFDQHRRRVEAQEPNGVLSAESVDVFQLSSVIHCKFMTPFIRHFGKCLVCSYFLYCCGGGWVVGWWCSILLCAFHSSSCSSSLVPFLLFLLAGDTIDGSPIHMWWIDVAALLQFFKNNPNALIIFSEFTTEVVVRGQLQLDYRSQKQDRLVQSLIIINGQTQPLWHSFVKSKVRSMFQSLLQIVASPPATVLRIFWMDPSW
jgi:hypothetical protein